MASTCPAMWPTDALRHAWSRRYGIPHESLGLAAVLEAVLLLLAALGLTLSDARGTGLTALIDARLASRCRWPG